MTTQKVFDLARASQASYASLASGMSVIDVESALRAPTGGFTPTQAQRFAAQQSVVLQYNDDAAGAGGDGTSLSVTVFKGTDNKLTLALRGTLEAGDWLPTDDSIITGGAGYDQIAALYSWWQRVSQPAGTMVAQYKVIGYPSELSAPAGALKLNRTSMAFGGAFLFLVQQADTAATGSLRDAIAADFDHQLEVTGHSLGGHLAMSFGAMFDTATANVTAFNAPGFLTTPTNVEFFNRLNNSAIPNGAKTTNVIATDTGQRDVNFSAIAGLWSRPGQAVNVPIENQWMSDEPNPPASRNHSQQILTDSLAVMALLESLDTGLTTERYKSLLAGAATGTAGSYEGIVGALRGLIAGNGSALPIGNAQREALYQALYGVQTSSASLAGKVRINLGSKDLAAKARNDFSALASLITLSPIVLNGLDGTLDTQLKTTWGQTYADWQTDKSMSVADREAGKETYTDKLIADRSAMLGWMIRRNELNENNVSPGYGVQGMHYKDVATGTEFDLGLPDNVVIKRQTQFGSDVADTINGNALDDHLYGGAGADTLNGLGGADYLEGNAGVDRL
jgi:hypothetical protein